jgi:hypothetical protein
MNQRELNQLVWKWVAWSMDKGLMEFNVGVMLVDVDDDELPPKEVEKMMKAWSHVRGRVQALAGEDS